MLSYLLSIKFILNIKTIVVTLLIGITLVPAAAQRSINLLEESSLVIKGTSTLHDWKSNVEELQARGQIEQTGNKLRNIVSFTLRAKVESIESGKRMMNEDTYAALNSKMHPYIYFELKEVTDITPNNVTVLGFLTIAGVRKEVEINGHYGLNNEILSIHGTKQIDMTSFSIKPPKALMGTIVVGKDVDIVFDLSFEL